MKLVHGFCGAGPQCIRVIFRAISLWRWKWAAFSYQLTMVVGMLSMAWTCCIILTGIPVKKQEIRVVVSLASLYLAHTMFSLNWYVLLELFSSGDAGGGKPIHGFLLDIGISESFLKICFESDKSPKGLVGESLLVVDFSPHGSGPFLHIGQSIDNLPVIIVVEGLIDKEVEADRVQPGLGCFCLSIVLIGASDAYFSDPRTGGSRGSRELVRHGDHNWRWSPFVAEEDKGKSQTFC